MKDIIKEAILNISTCGAKPKDLRVIYQIVEELNDFKSKEADNSYATKSLATLKEKLHKLDTKLNKYKLRAEKAELYIRDITDENQIPSIVKERDDLQKTFKENIEAKDLLLAGLNDVVDYQKEQISNLQNQLNRYLVDSLNLESGRCSKGHSSYHSYDFAEYSIGSKKGCFGCDFDKLQNKYFDAIDALKMSSGVVSRAIKQVANNIDILTNKPKTKAHTLIKSNDQLKLDLIKSNVQASKVLKAAQENAEKALEDTLNG